MNRTGQSFTLRALVITAVALTVTCARAEEEIQSRGFKLPSVSATPPAPPSPPPVPTPPMPAMYRLTIRPVGDGTGKVPLPPATVCPPSCDVQYPKGTPIVLAPVAAPGSRFDGWAGDCRGTGPCALHMDRSMTAEPRFTKLPPAASSATTPSLPTVLPAAPAPVPIPYPVAPAQLGPELSAISTMIADGKPVNAVMDAWKGYVTRRMQAKQPLDVRGTIQQVQRQAEAQIKASMDKQKPTMQDKLNSAGDAQLANVDLQNQLRQQQQTLQMMSNISKMMHDTAMAVIRNIGG